MISHRVQCADPIFSEMMGLDIARAGAVVVKSRGHCRGGFDEFFGPEQMVEVDLAGLTLQRDYPARRRCRMGQTLAISIADQAHRFEILE